MEGDPRFVGSQQIPYVAFEQWAEMIGLKGIKVDRAEQIDAAWRDALSADRPVIINALTDPEEPPLPPHVTVQQAKKLTESMLKGDPNRVAIAVNAMKEKIDEFVPGR
jgi:pyruvate dehydrogenase (quinone)